MTRDTTTLTHERLQEILHYEPKTGVFRWRKSISNRAPIGREAGCPNAHGHHVIRIEGRLYYAHRLAWLYMRAEWPNDEIDHANRDRLDNRWENLRAATHFENMQNRVSRKTARRMRGVYERGDKYCARIYTKGAAKYLGMYDSKTEAAQAYDEAARRLFGDFALTNFD